MPALDVDFHDHRISMLYWYPRIEDLDVPTPETEFFSLEGAEDTFELREGGVDMEQLISTLESIPVEEISQMVESLPTEKAHIRSDWKASRLAGGEGRKITTEPRVIHEQVLHLIDSMVMTGFPHRALAVREWVEVDELATSYDASICPEIRFILDEGAVRGGFVDVYEDDFDSSFTQDEANNILDEIWNRFDEDAGQLEEWAHRIATELDDTGWSVDFIQDTDGNWHITDMALYGLYWSDEKEKWHNISHIPEGKHYNLEENIPDSLPESK